jgi:hypothetical protein
MAVKTIDELAAANNIADTDVFIIDDGARNYKVAWSVLKRLIGSISNFTVDNTAGTITITLSTGASLTVTPHDPTKQDSLTFDSTPTAGSSNPVTSGGIKAALDDKLDAEDYAVFTGANASTAGSAGIVPAPAAGDTRFLSSSGAWTAPDSTPTAGSSNLPTSGGVKAALDGKQDELTFDTAPTAGSSNPVTSGGVFDAIQQTTAIEDITNQITWADSVAARSAVKMGNVIEINFRTSGNATTINTILFTLPTAYIPAILKRSIIQSDNTIYFSVTSYSDNVSGAQLGCKANGQVIAIGRDLPPYTGGNLMFLC